MSAYVKEDFETNRYQWLLTEAILKRMKAETDAMGAFNADTDREDTLPARLTVGQGERSIVRRCNDETSECVNGQRVSG